MRRQVKRLLAEPSPLGRRGVLLSAAQADRIHIWGCVACCASAHMRVGSLHCGGVPAPSQACSKATKRRRRRRKRSEPPLVRPPALPPTTRPLRVAHEREANCDDQHRDKAGLLSGVSLGRRRRACSGVTLGLRCGLQLARNVDLDGRRNVGLHVLDLETVPHRWGQSPPHPRYHPR